MTQRALPPDVVEKSLAEARQTEQARAWALWQQRFGQPASDARERARQARFLIGRGFAPSLVARIVRGDADHPIEPIDD